MSTREGEWRDYQSQEKIPNTVHKYCDQRYVTNFLATDATEYLMQFTRTPLKQVKVVSIETPIKHKANILLSTMTQNEKVKQVYTQCIGKIHNSIKRMRQYRESAEGCSVDDTFSASDTPYWNEAGHFMVMLVTVNPRYLGKVRGYQIVFTSIEEGQRIIIFMHKDGGAYMVWAKDTSEEALRLLLDGAITARCQVCTTEHICARPECYKFFGSGNKTRCGRCREVRYCSQECQHADWPRHKGLCAQAALERLYKNIEFRICPDAD